MNCTRSSIELGEYVDGTLPAGVRADWDAHVAGCSRCEALAADLRTIRAMARDLEPLPVPAHVWTRLSSAIESQPRRWWTPPSLAGFRWQTVGAVAMALVVAIALTWVGGQLAPAGRIPPVATVARAPAGAVMPVDAEIAFAQNDFTQAIAGLEQIALAERDSLDPDTVGVFDANLTVVDQAIGESRAALERDPGSQLALESLFDALRSKVALLQDIVSLINEMRKGNEDGAARIVSELNQ